MRRFQRAAARLGLLMCIALIAGCASAQDAIDSDPEMSQKQPADEPRPGDADHRGAVGDKVTMAPQESLALADDSRVLFVGISQDSRCPEGVQCMWMGEAHVSLELSAGGETTTHVLKLGPNGPTELQTQSTCVRMLDVSPYPKAGEKIEAEDYRIELEIVESCTES